MLNFSDIWINVSYHGNVKLGKMAQQ